MSANDPKALCDSIKNARDAGTKVVTFDSDTSPDCRDLFVNQATSDGIAKVEVDMIADQIGDSGEIAILSASANATNQNAWIDIMKKELAANHPKIKLVETVYGNDDDQTSFDKTAALLQKHPNLKGIISPTTVGIAAAARYLSTSSAKGKVALTGLGTPNSMRKYVKDGTVKEFALWNPERPRLSGGVRRRGPGEGRHLRQGGRQVQGRQARRVHGRRRRRRPARRPVQVQQGQHRPVQLLSRAAPAAPERAGRATARPAPSVPHVRTREEGSPMERVCFQLQVKPDRLAEYRDRHAQVWPEMLAALARTGWHNYSLFVREDGLLIGYFETPDLQAALAGMDATEVNARWQAEMAEFFVELGDARPDTGFLRLAEVFHLEDQLAGTAEHKETAER